MVLKHHMVSRNVTSADETTFMASYYGGYITVVIYIVWSLSGNPGVKVGFQIK